MTTAFPLLRLPEKALTLVASCMNYTELVLLSIVSDKTKEVVKSLNLSIEEVNISVDDVIRIIFNPTVDGPSSMIWSFYSENDNAGPEPIPVYMPTRVSVSLTRDLFQNPGLSVQKWIEHAHYIFSIKEIDYILFENETCKFDWTSLKDAIGKININTFLFDDLCNVECAQLAVKHFPSVRSFTAHCPSFNDPTCYNNILIQNWDLLDLGHEDMSLKIGLDHILMMNSKEISIESPSLTNKMVNRFFKHWIKGSNPRLKVARFKFVNDLDVDEEILLEGLDYQEAKWNGDEVYCIFREDGSLGVIQIERDDQRDIVNLCIFH